jgi:hypothetical protein
MLFFLDPSRVLVNLEIFLLQIALRYLFIALVSLSGCFVRRFFDMYFAPCVGPAPQIKRLNGSSLKKRLSLPHAKLQIITPGESKLRSKLFFFYKGFQLAQESSCLLIGHPLRKHEVLTLQGKLGACFQSIIRIHQLFISCPYLIHIQ